MLLSSLDLPDRTTSNPAAYLRAARQIETWPEEQGRVVRLSLLSTFTAEILRPYLMVEGARHGMLVRPHFGPINQIEAQVLEPGSALYASEPDVIVLALRLEEATPDLVRHFASLSRERIEEIIVAHQTRLRMLLEVMRRHSRATIAVFNHPAPQRLDVGFADAQLPVPQSFAVARLNDAVRQECAAVSGVSVFDHANLVYRFGSDRWGDGKLLYMARIPFGREAQLALSRQLVRHVRAALDPPCKCLVVDLDNTLWGGVIGEDGLGGIALGEDYPGNMFKAFQQRLLSLREQGVLLAIASKNNPADVEEVFAAHPDMVLKLEHFSAVEIHWNDKASSVRAIAKTLNIGLDAIAFFDDSHVERQWIKEGLPQVVVIDVPSDPAEYIEALDSAAAFDRLAISAEDSKRGEMLADDQRRTEARAGAASMGAFLSGLEMVATIGQVDAGSLPRVAQLLGKTNQFNLTTRRHSVAAIERLVDGGALALWLRLRDRFGDSGLVGVAIAVPQAERSWRIDSFLLSCRVLGRQVETAFLGVLARQIRARGGETLIGEYLPTEKNRQVADFYSRHAFTQVDTEGQEWRFDLRTEPLTLPEAIHLEMDATAKES